MTDKTEHTLDQLAENFVDALAVDWGYAELLGADAQGLLKNFHTISQVAQLHQSHHDVEIKESQSPRSDLTQLFRWGRFGVIEPIGSGAYGQVYRAHDDILDRDVALKLLKSEDSTPFKAKTFIQEAKRIAKVRHPHVLAVHGANIHDGQAGFWADLIKGRSLDQINDDIFSATELFKMCSQLVQGLAAIHKAGIIHGDIKPANIMRDENGDYLIMDFGAGLESAELQQLQGFVHGTPALMAPELFADQHAGFATDVYALGATLFKLATKNYPVETGDLVAIQQAHKKKSYRKIKSYRRDLPPAFAHLVEKMITPDPKLRPSPKNIIKALYEIEEAPQKRRNKMAIMAIVTLLVTGTAASLWGFYAANQAKDAAISAQNKAEEVNAFLQDMLAASSEMGAGREVRVADVLDQASESLFDNPPDDIATEIEMHQSLASSYGALDDFEKNMAHAQASLKLATDLYQEGDEPLVRSQLEMIDVLEDMEQHEESIAMAKQLIERTVEQLGVDHWYIKRAWLHQVTNLMALTRYDEATSLLDQHLSEIPEPQQASNNLGFQILHARVYLLWFMGQFDQAIILAKQAQQWLKDYPKRNLLNELDILQLLGPAQLEAGQIEESLATFETAKSLSVRMYGKESQPYLNVLIGMSSSQRLLDQPRAALATNTEAYELVKRLYGDEDNLRSISIGINLAVLLVELGDVAKGEEVMRETLEMATKVLGPENPATLVQEYNLAELLNNQGRFDEALAMVENTHQKKLKTYGENHPYVFLTLDNWAISLSGLGQHKPAIEMHQKAVEGISAAQGAKHQYALLVRQHQVDTLINANERAAVSELLPALVSDMQQTLGADDEGTIKYQKILNGWAPLSD